MPSHTHIVKVWITIPSAEIIPILSQHYLSEELIPELCKYDTRRCIEAIVEYANRKIGGVGAKVAVLSASYSSSENIGNFDCMLVLGGTRQELDKTIGQGKLFEHTRSRLEYEKTQYEKVRESAFNLMRNCNIKNFSESELHRVFAGSRNFSDYMAIIKREIADGLTIANLYEQDRDRGLGR